MRLMSFLFCLRRQGFIIFLFYKNAHMTIADSSIIDFIQDTVLFFLHIKNEFFQISYITPPTIALIKVE